MALKAKKPEAIEKRLKMMLFGAASTGKTRAAAQFPYSYFIDSEHGAENYPDAPTKELLRRLERDLRTA